MHRPRSKGSGILVQAKFEIKYSVPQLVTFLTHPAFAG